MIKQSQLNLRAPMFVTVRPERLDEFLKAQSIHRVMLDKHPNGFDLFWNEKTGSWRFKEDVKDTTGWYFTDYEMKQFMEIKLSNMRVEISKAVILNDLRITPENMEETFKKIREMLS